MLTTTKIFQVILSFTKREQRDFIKFLKSPYFNNSASMTALAELIIGMIQSDIDMSKEHAWLELEPNRAYDDTRFRKYCSDLLKLTERFLAQQEFDRHPLRSASYLLKTVASRRMDNLYNSSLRIARRMTDRVEAKGLDYLHDVYQVERYHQVILEADNRTQKLNVDRIVRNLDKFYIAQKLMSYMTAMSQKRIVNLEYDLLFIDEILDHIEKNPYPDTPQIRILYLVAKLYQTNDRQYFPELKELIFEHINLFPPAEANKIFRSSLNFLIGWSNEGRTEYLRELFEFYKYAIGQAFFFLEEGFNPWIFKTIVLVSLRLEEFAWCQEFIDSYAERLAPDVRDNAIRFNTARLHLYQKNHDKVLTLLNQVEFDDFSYNLSSRALLLATYYEIDEVEALFSFLDSFTVFLRRNSSKLPKKRYENYRNLIKYTRKLSKLSRRDKKKLNELREELESKSNLGDKRWLMEKIGEKLS